MTVVYNIGSFKCFIEFLVRKTKNYKMLAFLIQTWKIKKSFLRPYGLNIMVVIKWRASNYEQKKLISTHANAKAKLLNLFLLIM